MVEAKSSERSGKTILVVEDDDAVGDIITTGIKELTPFEAIWATNAVEALEIVKTLRPNLVVLDYQLPGINGLELYEKFQAIEQLRAIPTLLMSANLPAQARNDLPMSFIEKPFGLSHLFKAIEKLLIE